MTHQRAALCGRLLSVRVSGCRGPAFFVCSGVGGTVGGRFGGWFGGPDRRKKLRAWRQGRDGAGSCSPGCRRKGPWHGAGRGRATPAVGGGNVGPEKGKTAGRQGGADTTVAGGGLGTEPGGPRAAKRCRRGRSDLHREDVVEVGGVVLREVPAVHFQRRKAEL